MQSRAGEMSGLTTLVDRIRYWARTDPEREAFVFRRQDGGRYPLSRAAYLRLATRFAARLQSLGLQPGDVVCNFLVNSPERAVTDLGIMLSGATPMNASPLLADGADVKGCLRRGRAKALLVDPDQKDGAWKVCQRVLDPGQPGPCQSADLPDLKQVLYSRRSEQGAMLLLEELEASREQFRPVDIKPEDVAYIFTTSGSTGFSKLVARTYGSLDREHRTSTMFTRADENTYFWNDASLGWVGGFPNGLFGHGATLVLTDARAGKPSDYLEFVWTALAEEKVSGAALYTNVINLALKQRDLWKGRQVLSRLYTGGQPLRKESTKALTSAGGFAGKFTVVYGSTEAGVVATVDYEDQDSFEEFLVGEIWPELEVKIVDDDMKPLPNGRKGEILLKSQHLFKEYVGDQEATKNAFTDDGWFRSNDLGSLDDRGRLFVMGRRSDVIMRGAFIVVPQWLEVRLRQCPGVKDVVVVAVPDNVFYQEVCACVIRESGGDVTEKDLHQYCKELLTSGVNEERYQRAKYYLFFDEFPLNQNLKTDRRLLALQAAERLGLS